MILFFKILFRRHFKNKTVSAVNFVGLTLSLTAFLVIANYVGYETSFDNFHPESYRTFRILTTIEDGARKQIFPRTFPATGTTLQNYIPEITAQARINRSSIGSFIYQSKIFSDELNFADPAILDILALPIIEGNTNGPLHQANSIIISQSTAKKYFGSEDPIGKTLKYKDFFQKAEYTVTAVFADLPTNTHLDLEIIASYSSLYNTIFKNDVGEQNWENTNAYTYVVLNTNHNVQEVEKKNQFHYPKNRSNRERCKATI